MTAAEQELITLEREWLEAIQRNDFARLERLVGPDYAYTASGHGRWTRERWMRTVAVYDIHDFAFTDVDVRLFSDVAVVLSRLQMTATVAGSTRSGEFLLTDVWVRRGEVAGGQLDLHVLDVRLAALVGVIAGVLHVGPPIRASKGPAASNSTGGR